MWGYPELVDDPGHAADPSRYAGTVRGPVGDVEDAEEELGVDREGEELDGVPGAPTAGA